MGKTDTSENTVEDDDDDDDDETTSQNPHPSDSENAIDDCVTADNNSTTPNLDAAGSAASTRKRTTIDESTLSAEDLQKLESRRAYNRHCAAKARKRSKTLVAQLQSQVEELTKDKAELKRSNDLMRTQLDLLEQQNRTLLLNQLSAQPSSAQLTGGNFPHGGSISTPSTLMSMPHNIRSHTNSSMPGGNPMFNLPSNGLGTSGNGTIGSGSLMGGASSLTNASTSLMGIGAGTGGSGFGQLSILDRLRLQQQLQLQQQRQQLGLMAPSSSANGHGSLNDHDLILNKAQNVNSNFLG